MFQPLKKYLGHKQTNMSLIYYIVLHISKSVLVSNRKAQNKSLHCLENQSVVWKVSRRPSQSEVFNQSATDRLRVTALFSREGLFLDPLGLQCDRFRMASIDSKTPSHPLNWMFLRILNERCVGPQPNCNTVTLIRVQEDSSLTDIQAVGRNCLFTLNRLKRAFVVRNCTGRLWAYRLIRNLTPHHYHQTHNPICIDWYRLLSSTS